MDKLKVAFVDFWPEIEHENIFLPILEKHFDVQVTRINPDIVIHSIFGRMQETPKYKCKKILFLGENWRPEQFGSDYSISFDPHTDKNFRLPLWQFYLLLRPELKERLFNKLIYKENEFERWCAFTVSNGSNFLRNGAYQFLTQYKKVDSYGRYMTNSLELQQASQGKYWRYAKDEFFLKHPHKFMLTFENALYKYYCTEKIMDAFLVGSVPIYWGDPKVSEDWNPNAFVNVTNQDLNIVKEIDKDWKKFEEIYSQPIFTSSQKEKLENNLKNFEDWLLTIVKT